MDPDSTLASGACQIDCDTTLSSMVTEEGDATIPPSVTLTSKDDHVFAIPQMPAPRAIKKTDLMNTDATYDTIRTIRTILDTEMDIECDDEEYEEEYEEDYKLTLDTLPSEIFLHICSFLHAKFIVNTLSRVCQYFHDLVNDRKFWKVRLSKRWRKKYPIISVNNATYDWRSACMAREESYRLWHDPAQTMQYYRYTEGVSASVDCVHLNKGGTLLAFGSRDHYLNVLDLRLIDLSNPHQDLNQITSISKAKAHNGWIWAFTSLDTMLVSCSWDKHVTIWDMAFNYEMIRTTKLKSAVLSTVFASPSLLIAGCYDKNIYDIDPRSSNVVNTRRDHSRPVLAVAADEQYIVSASEDSTVAVYDITAGKVFKTIQMEAFPMCMSYANDQLWVGDKLGSVHIFDATDGDFDLIETYKVGHLSKVTGIRHTPGAIYTSSLDRTIRVLEPSLNPDTMTTLTQDQRGAIAGIDFNNGILASANCDISVGIWIPKDHQWD